MDIHIHGKPVDDGSLSEGSLLAVDFLLRTITQTITCLTSCRSVSYGLGTPTNFEEGHARELCRLTGRIRPFDYSDRYFEVMDFCSARVCPVYGLDSVPTLRHQTFDRSFQSDKRTTGRSESARPATLSCANTGVECETGVPVVPHLPICYRFAVIRLATVVTGRSFVGAICSVQNSQLQAGVSG